MQKFIPNTDEKRRYKQGKLKTFDRVGTKIQNNPTMATDITQTYARPVIPVTAEAPVFKPLAPVSIDRRPPVATQGSTQPAQHHSTNSIQITINPPAGADPHAIARAVAAELDKRERQRSLAKRSSMHDYDES